MLPQPLPPPLPSERVQWVAPFSHVGVDHTARFSIKDTQGRKSKAYICLFVCATTRAVHLEVVENLTATSFVMCLRRLAVTKGMPTLILSDNHKTFIAGETFLLDLQLWIPRFKNIYKVRMCGGSIRRPGPPGWAATLRGWCER